MGRKANRNGRVTSFGTGHSRGGLSGPDSVLLKGEITDAADPGRPVTLYMTPDDARRWAEHLIQMADAVDRRQAQVRKAAGK